MTTSQKEITKFFGKKNFKGIYTKNPLAHSPTYHKFDKTKSFITSYPLRAQHRIDKVSHDWPAVFDAKNAIETNKPFANNEFCRPNKMINEKLRSVIVSSHANGESIQQLSLRLGISVPRIDAVIKLNNARTQFQKSQNFSYLQKDLSKMAASMKRMFDEISVNFEGLPQRQVDNLTEIPMPKQTRQQFFQSIGESEPFGPVDAANTLNIEPANVTLEKLSKVDSEHKSEKVESNAFLAEMVEGERHLYKFTNARVGKVGYHYGSAKDDQKSGRLVGHRVDGRKYYPI